MIAADDETEAVGSAAESGSGSLDDVAKPKAVRPKAQKRKRRSKGKRAGGGRGKGKGKGRKGKRGKSGRSAQPSSRPSVDTRFKDLVAKWRQQAARRLATSGAGLTAPTMPPSGLGATPLGSGVQAAARTIVGQVVERLKAPPARAYLTPGAAAKARQPSSGGQSPSRPSSASQRPKSGGRVWVPGYTRAGLDVAGHYRTQKG